MSGIISIALRALAFLWTLLITALIGNVIASNINAAGSASAAVNFTMFVAALSWVAVLYGLAANFITALLVPLIMIPLDALAVIFTFISAIVLAAKLRAVNCGNINGRNLPGNWIAFGSADNEKRCREIQASTAFMWFLWATFCALLFFTWKQSRSPFAGSRSSRPTMSQVRV